MKLQKILLIVSICAISIGAGLLIAGVVLSLLHYNVISDIFLGISSILGVISLGLLVYRLVLVSKTVEPVVNNRPNKPRVVVKVVDVKDVPKSKEEKLFEQYEDLYKKNLISKEDLDQKRKELLGK